MAALEIRPFDESHVPDAGRLLAARHARHRRAAPLLPERFESAAEATAAVAGWWATDGASGAVAHVDGEVAGFLVGAPKSSSLWGSNAWVESAGLAVTEAETMRDLYAVAAARWVDEGRTAHYVLIPSDDAALADAWFRLGFGLQHVHAMRPAAPPATVAIPSGVTIRRAERQDIPVLAELEVVLPAHQAAAPVFYSGPTATLDECLAEWEESFEDPDYTTFVAVQEGAVVGSAVGCSLTKSSLHTGLARPDHAGFLGFAAVLPEARGCGAGRALGEAVQSWIAESGFRADVTDWRATNLLSSRTWPRLGYRPTFLRLHRVVGY
jgi:ribosomal protein S18 acetylase RimI-like enzyme